MSERYESAGAHVHTPGAQGLQVGERNRQYNLFGPVQLSVAGPGEARAERRVSVVPPWGLRGVHPLRGRGPLVTDVVARLVGDGGKGRLWVLHGLGGIGKTRAALEIAHQAKEAGADAWWVTGAEWGDFTAGMLAIAELIGIDLEAFQHADPADVLWAALAAWKHRWLLVVDNLDDPLGVLDTGGGRLAEGTSWVRQPGPRGLVVITSRDGAPTVWGADTVLQRLTAIPPEAGAQILIDLASTSGTQQEAAALAQRLGGLPLALHLAGAALADTAATPPMFTDHDDAPRTFAEYRDTLDAHFAEVFPAPPPGETMKSATARRLVGQTWELSLDQLGSRGLPEARPLLRLLSCMADAPIPYGLLLNPDWLSTSSLFPGMTGRQLWTVLTELDRLSLITLTRDPAANDPAADTLLLHPLVRETNAAQADLDDPEGLPGLAVRLVASFVVPPASEADEDPQQSTRWLVLAPHAFHALSRIEAFRAPIDIDLATRACQAATLAGRYHFAHGLYGQAETELRTVIESSKRLLGDQHPETLAARHQLARVLHERGSTADAESELRALIKDRQRVLGEDHRSTLATRNQLAWALRERGEYGDAERELHAVIEAKRRVLPDEHPDTWIARMDLAQVWHEQGQYEKADAAYQEVLAARRRLLGPDHPKTLNTMHDIANLRHQQGRLDQAADEYRVVLAARRRVHGEDHPKTLASQRDLAAVLKDLSARETAKTRNLPSATDDP